MGVNSNNPQNLSAGVCTTLTKPVNPYEGQMVYVTDVAELQVWNGTNWFSIYSDITPLENDIDQAQTDISTINSQLTVYASNIASNASAIAAIEADLLVFESEIDANASAISNIPTIPVGGLANQVLAKITTDNYDVQWVSVTTDGISSTLVDAKGDLLVASADNNVVRLPVGSNGNYLVADSTTTSGLAWSDAVDPIPLILALGGI